jgi:hypothetical protein
MSQVWTEFQNNATIRSAIPELQKLRVLGDFTNFDLVWNSATIPDADNDGYDIDPNWSGGFDYPMWINAYGNVGLIAHAAYWGNQQRGNWDVADRVNRSIGQAFEVMATGLWPEAEIFTKLWLDGDSEPATWNSDVPVRYTSKAGSHIANDRPSQAAGNYWIKYKVGNDVFGPFPIAVSGVYSTGGAGTADASFIRTTDEVMTGGIWDTITLNTTEFNDDPSVVSLNASTGAVTIAAGSSYSRFRVTGYCTIDSAGNGVYALTFRRNGVDQHSRTAGNEAIDNTGGAAFPLLSFASTWLPLDAGGETLELIVNTPFNCYVRGAYGMGMQVELK